VTQAEVAERAAVSQQLVSHLERGRGGNAALQTWASVGAALGLQLAAFFEQAPGTSQPTDLQHLRGQNLIVACAAEGGWVSTPESLLPEDGRFPRSVDVLLVREARHEAAVVELWDLLLDSGAAMRGLESKVHATRARLGAGWRVEGLFLVRRTTRNRDLVREFAPLFAARYPASSAEWLKAITSPTTPMPPQAGFAWIDVAGSRLIAARRPGPG
jgi:hypothetical protein